jgi:hypothetical protein
LVIEKKKKESQKELFSLLFGVIPPKTDGPIRSCLENENFRHDPKKKFRRGG